MVKMGFPTVIIVASLALFGVHADECPLCPDGWTQFEDSCLQFNTDWVDYQTATDTCKMGGAQLYEPQTVDQCHTVCQMADENGLGSTWIGVNDIAEEGSWVFASSGAPFDLGELWAAGEPNNWDHGDGAGEDCAHFFSSSLLNDNNCASTMNFICAYTIQKWLVANNC